MISGPFRHHREVLHQRRSSFSRRTFPVPALSAPVFSRRIHVPKRIFFMARASQHHDAVRLRGIGSLPISTTKGRRPVMKKALLKTGPKGQHRKSAGIVTSSARAVALASPAIKRAREAAAGIAKVAAAAKAAAKAAAPAAAK